MHVPGFVFCNTYYIHTYKILNEQSQMKLNTQHTKCANGRMKRLEEYEVSETENYQLTLNPVTRRQITARK